MHVVQEKTDVDARKIGVEVLDVRLKRVDFPLEISDSVYRRMDAERKRVANELRATGNAESEKIRADADRQREVILAQAYRDAQKIKGEGDAKATALYAGAFGLIETFLAAEFSQAERHLRRLSKIAALESQPSHGQMKG